MDEIMKVLTIKQPFASLIALKEKKIETRSWKTNYRGPLYIHAGKSTSDECLFSRRPFIDIFKVHDINSFKELPFGEIIAKVNLIDCIKVTEDNGKIARDIEGKIIAEGNEYCFGYYDCDAEDRYAWIFEDIEEVEHVKAKGKLNLWNFRR